MPPSFSGFFVLLAYLTPIVLISLPFTFFILAFADLKYSPLPLIVILIALPQYQETYQPGKPSKEIKREDNLSILSYNVKYFRQANSYDQFSPELIEWVVNDHSDIKCLQEFSSNSKWPELNVEGKICTSGYHAFVHTAKVPGMDHHPGMAIFSKHRIIDTGLVWEKEKSVNAGIYADVLIKNDTVRIYNVHLASMGLHLIQGSFSSLVYRVLERVMQTSVERQLQINMLLDHLTECPYPYIGVGDFNEMPHSYNYLQMKKSATYSFIEAGHGLGTTYADTKLPIRIDHQFHSKKIDALQLTSYRKIRYSDHYPLYGRYRIN
ncbi:MAG: endonuclease/exonuclease/phosphatase family protein [Bacteroidota bacterium]